MSTSPLTEIAVPLRALDPADPDMSDLAILRELVGDARVVCLGESAHGVSEYYRLKDRILRFLVSELGFSAFVMESGFAEGLAVDDWVLGGAGGLDQITATGITYGFGECDEMRAQLRWMRDWNAEHDSGVRFYGMDAPGSFATPRPAIEACLARITPRTGDDALLALADLGERFQAHARYTAMTTDERQRLSRGIADLGDRAGISGDDVAHLCALGAKCVDDYLLADRNARDELMAETVRWILDREERIVVSAHNGHVQRCLAHTGDPVLGHLLAPVLGDELVVIGTTRTGGVIPELRFEGEPPRPSFISLENLAPPPPHTLDAVMEATGLPLHLVDLRRVPPETLGAATAICAQSFVVDIDPTRAFDALVHVRSLTPVPRWTRSTPTTVAAAHERPQ